MKAPSLTKNIGAGNGRRVHGGRVVLTSAVAAASIALFALYGGAAQAATSASGPSVTMSLVSSKITSRARPVVTFISSAIPAGAVLYLQRASGAGQDWQNVARTTAGSGTAQAPADPAGSYEYRVVAVRGNTTVAQSAPVRLTVTGQADNCGICKVGRTVLPWLKLFEGPVLQYVVEKILDWLGVLIAS